MKRTKTQLTDAIAATGGTPLMGTKPQLEAQLEALEEAVADTAAAVNAPATPAQRRPRDTAAAPLMGLAVGIAAIFGGGE